MTLAFAESLEARHSRNSHHPFPMGDGFAATLVRCFAAACRVARPPVRIRPGISPSQRGLLLPSFRRVGRPSRRRV